MNQEEWEAFTHQTTQQIVSGLQQTTNAEEMIRSLLNSYGIAMFAAGRRKTEEWISRTLASLPIPILITRTLPEGAQAPVVAYHWQTRDREGDAVTFAYCLEQALLPVLQQQEQRAIPYHLETHDRCARGE
jgi:hypothetical protein